MIDQLKNGGVHREVSDFLDFIAYQVRLTICFVRSIR